LVEDITQVNCWIRTGPCPFHGYIVLYFLFLLYNEQRLLPSIRGNAGNLVVATNRNKLRFNYL